MGSSGEQVRRADCDRVARNLWYRFLAADGIGASRSVRRGVARYSITLLAADLLASTFRGVAMYVMAAPTASVPKLTGTPPHASTSAPTAVVTACHIVGLGFSLGEGSRTGASGLASTVVDSGGGRGGGGISGKSPDPVLAELSRDVPEERVVRVGAAVLLSGLLDGNAPAPLRAAGWSVPECSRLGSCHEELAALA